MWALLSHVMYVLPELAVAVGAGIGFIVRSHHAEKRREALAKPVDPKSRPAWYYDMSKEDQAWADAVCFNLVRQPPDEPEKAVEPPKPARAIESPTKAPMTFTIDENGYVFWGDERVAFPPNRPVPGYVPDKEVCRHQWVAFMPGSTAQTTRYECRLCNMSKTGHKDDLPEIGFTHFVPKNDVPTF